MATMSFMLILVITVFIVLIAACTFGRNRRNPVRATRLVDYLLGLSVTAAVCFLPVVLLIWVVHSYVIPIPMATEVFALLDEDPDTWERNLENEKIAEKHGEEFRKRGRTEGEIRLIQEVLWKGWPIIVGVGLLLLLGGIQALAHGNRALLRDVGANDSCTPGSAGSYVGIRTLDSPWEDETDILSSEEREATSHSMRRRGNRSSREIHQRDGQYERIAVARDDFARVILSSIAERGPAHVIEHLAEVLHEPGHHEIEESASGFPEHDDQVYEERGYVLIWNVRRRYVSLAYQVEPGTRGAS
jgi:hypothetical protein